jgi:hypothetical protein
MFWGCETETPMIAETNDYIVVMDGHRCEVYDVNSMDIIDQCLDTERLLRC